MGLGLRVTISTALQSNVPGLVVGMVTSTEVKDVVSTEVELPF